MATPTTITVGANSYTLVSMPSTPAARSISLVMHDTVGANVSPYTRQTQTMTWPGADWWEASVQMPPMRRQYAANWIAFLAQLRGKQCVFMLGDPSAVAPQGFPRGTVQVDGTVSGGNLPTSTVLHTKGWITNTHRLLLPGDYLQMGNRLYMCLDIVNSDTSGKAAINVWPSIRETPADATPISFKNPQGLFRLADNARSFSADVMQQYGISLHAEEVR